MAFSCCKTSYNNLLDKPFYEEELLSVKPTVDRNNIGFVWRKVSDNNLSTQLENGLNAQAWIDGKNGPINVAVVGDFVIYGEFFAVFVKKANAVLDPAAMGDDRLPFIATFPEAGMYFLEKPERMLLLGLAVAGASEPEIAWDGSPVRIKPLDARFLPEGVGPLLVTANTTNGTDYTFSHTGNEIAQHISMGGNAVMNASDGTVGLCYGYYMAISSNGSGQTPYIAFGVLAYANSKPCLMLFLVPMDSTAGMSQMFALETYTATPT